MAMIALQVGRRRVGSFLTGKTWQNPKHNPVSHKIKFVHISSDNSNKPLFFQVTFK